MRIVRRITVTAALASAVAARDASAQAWSYPALQPPRVTEREYNFAVGDAGSAGTMLLFQWREGYGVRSQLSMDVGIADPDRPRSELVFFLGGQYAYQLARAASDQPLDFLLTLGANLAVTNFTLVRIPAGVSLGHRFDLEGNLALTPFVHPRVSLDLCGGGGCNGGSDLSLVFDVGANFEVSRNLALRAAATFGGRDRFEDDGFAISLAWSPPGLARKRR
jgi:hypothetical protein